MSDTKAGGMKHDGKKVRMELLSPLWLWGVAAVLTFGAIKYDADNWREGISQRRLLGAAMRHQLAYLNGQDADPETGLSHLLHASCCLMFAFELRETHPELDDRYRMPAEIMTRILESIERAAGTWPAKKPKHDPVSSGDNASGRVPAGLLRCLRCGRTGSDPGACPCLPDPGGSTLHQSAERVDKWTMNCGTHGPSVGYGADPYCWKCEAGPVGVV